MIIETKETTLNTYEPVNLDLACAQYMRLAEEQKRRVLEQLRVRRGPAWRVA